VYEVWVDTRNTQGEVVEIVESITASKQGAHARAHRINNHHDLYPNQVAWVEYNEAAEVAYKGNAQRKLTNAEIDEIRELRATGLTNGQLGDMFGVHRTTVSKVCTGVRRPPTVHDHKGTNNANSRLNEDQVRDIRARYSDGASIEALRKEYGISDAAVSHVVHRKSWTHVE
jgi:DNA-binding transcriptional regulator YiaG